MLLKLFLALWVTPLVAYAHTARECERSASLRRPTLHEVNMRFRVLEAANRDFIVRSQVEAKRFWREGYVELQSLAKGAGSPLFEIFSGYYDHILFLLESTQEYDASLAEGHAHVLAHREKLRAALTLLESLGPNDNLKKRHWEAVGVVYTAIFKLTGYLNDYLLTVRKSDSISPVDPFRPFTPDQIHSLFEELEQLTLDRMLNFTVRVAESLRRREMAELDRATAPSVPTAVAVPTETVVVAESAPTPVVITEEPIKLDPSDLATVLSRDLPLSASMIYRANVFRNERNETFTVHMEPDLVGEDYGSDRVVVRRLLRAILTANRSTGIVHMGGIGPGIVEVRAVLRGAHKRIIGCLKGRDVVLKYLVDIKDSVDTYFRRIDPHLCK